MSDRPRLLFEVSHPKHVHQLRYVAERVRADCEVLFAARDKEVVLKLLERSGFPYREYGVHARGLFQKFSATPRLLLDYGRLVRSFRPDVIVSKASPYAAVVASFSKAKTMIMPDSEVVALTNRFVAPLSDMVVTPRNFSRSLGARHRRVDGLFEETYLHPSILTPDPSVRDALGVDDGERYFVLRFVGWNANHDVGRHGFRDDEKEDLVEVLSRHGRVFISSESELPGSLEPYRLDVAADRIHDVLHFASLYVGDSQTMATESALLGTPSVRYNSFVGDGDMSNFRVLEEKHGLLVNAGSYRDARDVASALAEDGEAKSEWLEKRRVYFSGKEDINDQVVDLIREMAT